MCTSSISNVRLFSLFCSYGQMYFVNFKAYNSDENNDNYNTIKLQYIVDNERIVLEHIFGIEYRP